VEAGSVLHLRCAFTGPPVLGGLEVQHVPVLRTSLPILISRLVIRRTRVHDQSHERLNG
jgi:hypothetical protein